MRTKLLAACIAVLLVFTSAACNANGGNSSNKDDMANTNQLLTDVNFLNGFGVMGIQNGSDNLVGVPEENIVNNSDYTVHNVLNYGGKAPFKFNWRLAQWGTKAENSFGKAENYRFKDLGGGKFEYGNNAKNVTVDTGKGEITLATDTSYEYDAPRKDGQLWPHLLIEQVFKENGNLRSFNGARSFNMKFDCVVNECVNLMSAEEYNPSRHAAQCSWYITLNSSKPGVDDYIWFGLPIFDNRHAGEFMGGSVFFDHGLDTGTGMLIYPLDSRVFLKKGVEVGDKISVNVDVLPYLRDALQEAQKHGLFLDHTIGDFVLGSTNLGWEIPGTFKCSMTVSNLGLILE